MFRFDHCRRRAPAPAAAAFILILSAPIAAGPYSGPTETAHDIDPAIPADSSRFVEWADAIDSARTRFAPNGSTDINQAGGFNSLGDLSQAQIDNGQAPGVLTVTFPTGIGNGAGPDFAVFENGFTFPFAPFLFLELAFVEVSSNGSDFVRFDAVSTNTTWQGTFGQSFAGFDTTNIYNLAGKHAGGFGTPFDLDELIDADLVQSGAVNLDDIQFVRLVDIPGSGDILDSQGNPILDNWLTTGTGGFDFRLGEGLGVGVLHQARTEIVLGDFNGDGVTTNRDIKPFLLALQDLGGFATAYPDIDPAIVGDFNADNTFNENDIDGFVQLLTDGQPNALTQLLNVPEPTSALLLGLGISLCFTRTPRKHATL